MSNLFREMIIQRRLDHEKTLIFDEKYKIDTSNRIVKAYDDIGGFRPLEVFPQNFPRKYNGYMGVSLFELDIVYEILNRHFKNLEEYTFIDIGSGKGKVICFNIVNNIIYKKQIGIEYLEDLANISKANIYNLSLNFNVENINILNKDVFDYKFEDCNSIYFFFQTFSFESYKNFINKNKETLLKNNNIIVNVCPYDEESGSFDHKGIFNDFELVEKYEYISIFKTF